MKKIFSIILLFNCLIVAGQNELNIVPMPVHFSINKGIFQLNKDTRITIVHNNTELERLAFYLQSRIKDITGLSLSIEIGKKKPTL